VNIRPQNIARYEKAEQLFKEGKALKKIRSETGLDPKCVSRYLKFKGYSFTRNQHWIKNDTSELQKAGDLYEEGYGIKKISQILHISDYRIAQYLESQGYQWNLNNQTHEYYDDVFEVIDTEEKAYWLGFLSADGSHSNKILELSLKEGDRNHIKSFGDFISPTAEIQYRSKVKACRIQICSKKICDDLTALGVTPNKSLTLEFCDQVPKHLIHHYIRGYVDGDGSIGLSYRNKNDKRKHASFGVLGTESFLDQIISHLNLHHNKKQRHGKAYSIGYSGNKLVPKILNKLYADATIYLPRKYKKYQEIVENCRPSVKVVG
jgi:hypothetical protein